MVAVNYMQQNTEDEQFMEELKKLVGDPNEVKQSQGLFQNQDMAKLLEAFMEETIPDEIKKDELMQQFWAILGNTVKLTFLTREDIPEYEALFEMAKVDFTMSIPPYKFSFKHQQMLEQLRIYFLSAIRRSIGSSNHVFNERIILGGTISQQIRINTESFKTSPAAGGGFLAKIKNMI